MTSVLPSTGWAPPIDNTDGFAPVLSEVPAPSGDVHLCGRASHTTSADAHVTMEPRRGQSAIDLVVALPLAIATLPLVLVALLASWWSYRANPLFCQDRIGHGGKRITFMKVRSLPACAPKAADKYTINDEVKISPVGRFIRKTKLDELPQLWLVVCGTLSLVGPRAEMQSLAVTFCPDFVAARTTVRPGVTGLWQISEAAGGLIGEAPEYDLFYLQHHSFLLDVWIIYRTARQLLPGSGGAAITLADVPAWAQRRNVADAPVEQPTTLAA